MSKKGRFEKLGLALGITAAVGGGIYKTIHDKHSGQGDKNIPTVPLKKNGDNDGGSDIKYVREKARAQANQARQKEDNDKEYTRVKAGFEKLFEEPAVSETKFDGANKIFSFLKKNFPEANIELNEDPDLSAQDIIITTVNKDVVRVRVWRDAAVVKHVVETDKDELFDLANHDGIAAMIKNKFLLQQKVDELEKKYGGFYGNNAAIKEYQDYVLSLGMQLAE